MVPAPPQQRRSSLFVRKGSTIGGPMKEVELEDFYTLLKPVLGLSGSSGSGQLIPSGSGGNPNVSPGGGGRFGYGITLQEAEDKQNKARIAVKIFQKTYVKQVDFIREYNFSYFLSPHPNIVETYENVYSTSESFFFVQELCPMGSLKDFLDLQNNNGGSVNDAVLRNVMSQVISALEFMHTEGLVYRNLKPESILVFAKDLSKIKLSDFGATRKQGAIVKHMDSPNPCQAPEVCDTLKNEAYGVDKSVDIWALGVLIYYVARNGRYPWSKACIMCKPYYEWEQWMKRKSAQLPPKWSRFSEKAMKLFRLTLNPKAKERGSIKDAKKLLKYKWVKEVKSMSEDALYMPDDSGDMTKSQSINALNKKSRRSALQQWIAATMSTMSEISEQVVSAAE